MALKSIKYEQVDIYDSCPAPLRKRIVQGLLLTVTGKGQQPTDLLTAEANHLSSLCSDIIHIYITSKTQAIIALAGTARRPNTHIAKITFSTQNK